MNNHTITNRPLPDPWKPTGRQVHAAACAIARTDIAEWCRLTQAQRDDYLIDAHAGLVAAHHTMPPPVTYTTIPVNGMVCMSREHADLYAALFRVRDRMVTLRPDDNFTALVNEEHKTLARLRALASPERATT